MKEVGTMTNLTGSKKQVKWAEEIRSKVIELAQKTQCTRVINHIENIEEASQIINNYKFATSQYKTDSEKTKQIMHIDFELSCRKDYSEENTQQDKVKDLDNEEKFSLKTEITSTRVAQRIAKAVKEQVNLDYSPCDYEKDEDGNYILIVPASLKGILEKAFADNQ